MRHNRLVWQSALILAAVVPAATAEVLLETRAWTHRQPAVVFWTLGLSLLFAFVTWKLRAATAGAALTGLAITASLIYSTAGLPFRPWRTALVPVLAVSVLAAATTRIGRTCKQTFGTAEPHRGRAAAQIAANLGAATLLASGLARSWAAHLHGLAAAEPLVTAALAALAEAAADTVSSELGQILGGTPRMITTLRPASPGTDGAVSFAGSTAGVLAALLVALLGAWALGGNAAMFWISAAAAVFGLFFDSLLGATFERAGRLNNDAVNFLSTLGAAAVALVLFDCVR